MAELSAKSINLKNMRNILNQYAIYFVFVIFIFVIHFYALARTGAVFLSGSNLINILNMSATRLIIALGMGGILITAGVDLGAGRQVGLAAVLSASLLQTADYSRRMYPNLPVLPLIVPILIAMIACGIFGFLNGWITARLKIPAFITTLGTMVIVYGTCSLYFDRKPYGAQPIGGLDARFSTLGTNSFRILEGKGFTIGPNPPGFSGEIHKFPINYIVLIAIVMTVFIYILYNKTTYGKNIYAIGGNAEAARLSGINVGKVKITIMIVVQICSAISGILISSQVMAGTFGFGKGWEMTAISSVIIGGASLSGGLGKVSRTMVGLIFLGVIINGMTLLNVNEYAQYVVRGGLILLAVLINTIQTQRKN